MYHTTERKERQNRRHAMVLTISLHFALVAMLYFSMSGPSDNPPSDRPAKVTVAKERPTASAQTVKLP